MRNMMCLFSVVTAAWFTVGCAETITIDPGQSVIVVPGGTNDARGVEAAVAAARELGKHLELMAGTKLETIDDAGKLAGRYPIYVGIPVPGDRRELAPEEARWVVQPEATYLYGDIINGTLFAVYGFLEDELGVRWLEPGDRGIACQKRSSLVLIPGVFSWAPALGFRGVRPGVQLIKEGPQAGSQPSASGAFEISKEAHNRYVGDVRVWQKRMRMGSHVGIPYGHAFTTWWKQYGQDHPDYFAVNKFGKRAPENDAPISWQNIKLCPSNPKVVDQIIQNWLAITNNRPHGINVCENDSGPVNFCTCSNCTALDVVVKGQEGPFGQHLTDRYVYLCNAVARKAREYDPEAFVVTYAYNQAEQPPRRQKLEPNIVVGFAPTTVDLAQLERLFGGWAAAGMKRMFLRPNWPIYFFDTTLPVGFERHFHDAFQTAYRHGVVGTDYDCMRHTWPVNGLADYIQARAFSDPAKPFEYWEEHYCSAFGPAASDVKRYYRYWRETVWEQRVRSADLVTRGEPWQFGRRLMGSLDRYYQLADFDRTDALLQEAAKKELSESERAGLEQLLLGNRHARLVFKAASTKDPDKYAHSLALVDFREKHKDTLHFRWQKVFVLEGRLGDCTGANRALAFRRYLLPWLPIGLAWKFKIDPRDVGLKEGWQNVPYNDIKAWDALRTDYSWEKPEAGGSEALRAQLKDYDGVGWYACQLQVPPDWKEREAHLYFGAVNDSCRVYVNGRLTGEHTAGNARERDVPFTIRIDPCVDWSQKNQTLVVRVLNTNDTGGIRAPVWLLSTEKGTNP